MRTLDLRRTIWAVVLCAALGGCAVSGSFSPAQGPLAEAKPTPSYPARMTGVLSGQIAVDLPAGGSCTGSWSLRGNQQQSFDLSADWDQVYGPGYYTAHVLGVRAFVRTSLHCARGADVRVELSNEHNTRGNTRGVAEDDHGNVFKVSVYN